MDENTPSIWLTGILEQPPTMIMRDGTNTIQFDLIIDGPDGPVEVAVEATGASHAAFIATHGQAKATASSSTAGSTTTMTNPSTM